MSRRKNRTSSIRKTRRLRMQPLEDRKLMAADFGLGGMTVIPQVEFNNGTIAVEGSFLADEVQVSYMDMGTDSTADDYVNVTVENMMVNRQISVPLFDAAGNPNVDKVVFHGYGGHDHFENNTAISSTARGGVGNDRLYGGTGKDWLYGDGGHDLLMGRDNVDYLFGGAGDDGIYGGNGGDVIRGHAGNDTIHAGAGDDTVDGGGDDDLIKGSTGDDNLRGGSGQDRIYGHQGDDTLTGDRGHDRIYGGSGNDMIAGNSGNDYLRGDSGNDSVLGGDGEDFVYGNAGNDLLDGGDDDDTVIGGADADAVFGGDGFDWCGGGDGDDFVTGGELEFNPNGPSSIKDLSDWNSDFVHGHAGADILVQSDQLPISPWYWADETDYDANENDRLVKDGIFFSTGVAIDFNKFGHIYNGPTH